MSNRLPQPALVGLAPDKTPPLIDLGRFYAADFSRARVGTAPLHDDCLDRGEGSSLFLILGVRYSDRPAARVQSPVCHCH
jgi:hypothetical protein